MVFEIESKWNVDDKVQTLNKQPVTIKDIKMSYCGRIVTIKYLVEFSNQERRWVEESGLDVFI